MPMGATRMTSGKRITEREIHAILRLLSYRSVDGTWLLTHQQIAEQLDLSVGCVGEHIRQSAVKWGKLIQWRPVDSGE